MGDPLREKFGMTVQEQAGAGRTAGKLKGLLTFFTDAVSAVKDLGPVQAIVANAPWWAEGAGLALAEAAPPVKFLLELFKNYTKEDDPEKLGLLACTLAYQRAVEEAIQWAGAPEAARPAGQDLKDGLAALAPSPDLNFRRFSFAGALGHEFTRSADEVFQHYLAGVGYSEAQRRRLELRVHRRFVSHLKSILSHGRLKDRFEPFTRLMELGTEEEIAYDALLTHVEHQRWQFEEAPVLRSEPFALQHVYIPIEAGCVPWRELRDGSATGPGAGRADAAARDPFNESCGGRQDLLTAVLDRLGDPGFHDAIVIQGAAGSGKSSFTLRLCTALEQEGLCPIRVRLRDLPLDRHVSEALPRALFPSDHELPERLRGRATENPFRGGAIFNERVEFGRADICRYVIILDGWDEVSVSVDEGFQIRLSRLLEQLRSEFLRRPGPVVRLILTGRPSPALSESKFLLADTPVFTLRPLRPAQLRRFTDDLREALAQRPIPVEQPESERWQVPAPEELAPILDRYREEFDAERRSSSQNEPSAQPSPEGSLAVLGLPLLTHLAVRLVSRWDGDRAALVQNPTTLYRSMVDLTCEGAGKAGPDCDRGETQAKIAGQELRALLHRTAAAMTVGGGESISYEELSLRLELGDDRLDHKVGELTEHHALTALMISFFFRGGHKHLGCEFVHKSFREYLLAEGIVEALKDYGRAAPPALPEREPYWKDFADDDPRHDFSRRLSLLLAPQWLSAEVVAHLRELLDWEIARAAGRWSDAAAAVHPGTLPPLTVAQWERVRDGLADVWDWWAEGVHLRPQPVKEKKTGTVSLNPSYAEELVAHDCPSDPERRKRGLAPARTVTMDAHLGDGLFRLAALVHFHLAENTGWLAPRGDDRYEATPTELWEGVSDPGKGPRRCQTRITQGQREWVIFAPSGKSPFFFQHYMARINGAAWRVGGWFPRGVDASGTDLRQSAIASATSLAASQTSSCWNFANLGGTLARGGCFQADSFIGSLLFGADFSQSDLVLANLTAANLEQCSFTLCDAQHSSFAGAFIQEAVFWGAHLADANFYRAKINGTFFVRADLTGAELGRVEGTAADFTNALLVGARFGLADLTGAKFTGAVVDGAYFCGAKLDNVEGVEKLLDLTSPTPLGPQVEYPPETPPPSGRAAHPLAPAAESDGTSRPEP